MCGADPLDVAAGLSRRAILVGIAAVPAAFLAPRRAHAQNASLPDAPLVVDPIAQARKLGTRGGTIRTLIAKARDAGYERLSLSVEPGNPARKLYERHGFAIVDEGAEAWTMVATL